MSNIDFSKVITLEIKEEESAKAEQERINHEARAYLNQTDWYVTRHQETGEPIPDDVLILRQEAREKVIDLPPLGDDDVD